MANQNLETANKALGMAVQEDYNRYSVGASSSQGPLPQGRLKAKVVAADSIRASDTLKEVVVYKIRAADANGEWTVSRRYSNFEQLHRQLRDVSNTMCVCCSSVCSP